MFPFPSKLVRVGLVVAALGSLIPLPVLASNLYGAFAYSRSTGKYGYSLNYTDSSFARSQAIIACENIAGAGDCASLFWFSNGCGSLVKGQNKAAMPGIGWGSTRQTAETMALDDCNNRNGQSCLVIETVCTGN